MIENIDELYQKLGKVDYRINELKSIRREHYSQLALFFIFGSVFGVLISFIFNITMK